jgi:hypothetical protein
MNGISWRHKVVRIPFDGRDPEEALQEQLRTLPHYYRVTSATIRDEGWTLIVEDREAE